MFARAHMGAVGEFAASHYGVITRKQAAEIGTTEKVIRRWIACGHLTEALPGVLVVAGAPATWHRTLLTATLAGGGHGVGGFRSAAALHCCDGYEPGAIELLVPSWRRQLAGFAVQHRGPMPRSDITVVDGIRCTSIASTLCDIASVDPLDWTRAAFESMWRAGTSLTSIGQTAQRLHQEGRRGTDVILDLLDEAEGAPPTDSVSARAPSRAMPRRRR